MPEEEKKKTEVNIPQLPTSFPPMEPPKIQPLPIFDPFSMFKMPEFTSPVDKIDSLTKTDPIGDISKIIERGSSGIEDMAKKLDNTRAKR